MSNTIEKVTKAARTLCESLKTIVDLCPNPAFVEMLKQPNNQQFLSSMLNNSDKGLSEYLEDPAFKLAVEIENLYSNNKLEALSMDVIDGVLSSYDKISAESQETQTTANSSSLSPSTEDTNIFERSTSGESPTKNSKNIPYSANGSHLSNGTKQKGAKLFDEINSGSHQRGNNSVSYEVSLSNNHKKLSSAQANFDGLPELPKIPDPALEQRIFTHESFVSSLNIDSNVKLHKHNERLEFLGDSFLNFIVSTLIYEAFPYYNEGQLSQLRSELVRNKNLFKWAKLYGFDTRLITNYSALTALASDGKSIADTFEAYLGGIYESFMKESNDGVVDTDEFLHGWFAARKWVEQLSMTVIDEAKSVSKNIVPLNRSAKQELSLILDPATQTDYIRAQYGLDFVSCFRVNGIIMGIGKGPSIKESETRAAMEAIENEKLRYFWSPSFIKKVKNTEKYNGYLTGNATPEIEEHEVQQISMPEDSMVPLTHPHVTTMLLDALRIEVEAKNQQNKENVNEDGGDVEKTVVPKSTTSDVIARDVEYLLGDGTSVKVTECMTNAQQLNMNAKNSLYARFSPLSIFPAYEVFVTVEGLFLTKLTILGEIRGYGLNRNKKISQQLAATLALQNLDNTK
ncbi:hypothetical protein CANARDRAFT_175592 [[Candida] arabinofermentans NRRL YB-2248]|uniref:RNase III domain-containing protein n=1 Tax=[Candida] arabinofermentans NRRL YB-2248 TaxID=983967 RepID=A0A1E4T261_9ASCO|nr:hypothetical protein CANARDRAFT_175592 [[Candida] arabinofermentans NRRL YB-2248]